MKITKCIKLNALIIGTLFLMGACEENKQTKQVKEKWDSQKSPTAHVHGPECDHDHHNDYIQDPSTKELNESTNSNLNKKLEAIIEN